MYFVSYARVGINGALLIENGMTDFPSSLTSLKQIRQWETEMAEQLEVDHVTLLTFQEMMIRNARVTEGTYTHR